MMEQEKLTMEERIARAARSQAASPEAAVRLVQQLAQLHTVHIFHGCDDLTLMYELIGPYMEQMDDDLLHYSGFCRSIYLALADNKPPAGVDPRFLRSEEHTSELQSHSDISYAVFCLKKKFF